MYDLQTQELYSRFIEWSFTRQSTGQPYLLSTDKKNFERIAPRALQLGGLQALSAFDRAAHELGIVLRKPKPQPIPIPANFQEMLNALTPGELRAKITPPAGPAQFDPNDLRAARVRDYAAGGYDPQFHDWFNRFSAGERPSDQTPEGTPAVTLTREQYYAMPANVIARKYASSPEFRDAVDKLFANGAVRSTNITEAR
jgi:hypothetical protein